VRNQAQRLEDVWGSEGITPCILNHDTRWKCVVSFMPWALYSPGKELLPPTE